MKRKRNVLVGGTFLVLLVALGAGQAMVGRAAAQAQQRNIQAPRFEVDPFRKYCLLNGLDEISLTLRHADKIRAYETRRSTELPWLFR